MAGSLLLGASLQPFGYGYAPGGCERHDGSSIGSGPGERYKEASTMIDQDMSVIERRKRIALVAHDHKKQDID